MNFYLKSWILKIDPIMKIKNDIMKKLLLLIGLMLTILSCSKDDDNCECYYYEQLGKNANCEFERIYGDDARKDFEFEEDRERLREVADNFKCD